MHIYISEIFFLYALNFIVLEYYKTNSVHFESKLFFSMSPINMKTEETLFAIEERILNSREMLVKPCLKRLLYTFSLNLSNLRPICIWQNITNLTLWKCDISFLPIELGLLPFLNAINLSQNHLAQSKWTWLEQATIKKNLTYLDIGDNSLTKLPLQIVKLNSLEYLVACNNKLRHLPSSIGFLQNLKFLHLSYNNLLTLPGTLKYLQLKYLNISGNPFLFNRNRDFINNLKVIPTLLEWSAKIITRSGILYDTNIIPRELAKYLDEANYCYMCKEICIDNYIKHHFLISHTSNLIAEMVQVGSISKNFINIECYFCSKVCHTIKVFFF